MGTAKKQRTAVYSDFIGNFVKTSLRGSLEKLFRVFVSPCFSYSRLLILVSCVSILDSHVSILDSEVLILDS